LSVPELELELKLLLSTTLLMSPQGFEVCIEADKRAMFERSGLHLAGELGLSASPIELMMKLLRCGAAQEGPPLALLNEGEGFALVELVGDDPSWPRLGFLFSGLGVVLEELTLKASHVSFELELSALDLGELRRAVSTPELSASELDLLPSLSLLGF